VSVAAGIGRMDIAGGTIADDFDGDGLPDVVFSSVDRCSPLRLYRSRGNGTFQDVSEAAGILGQLGGLNIVQTDYNNDGRLDLYVSNTFGENFLYHNNGDGTFTDVAAKLGVLRPLTSFTTWFFDYDNDGWLDLFVVSFPPSVAEFVKHYLKIPPLAE